MISLTSFDRANVHVRRDIFFVFNVETLECNFIYITHSVWCYYKKNDVHKTPARPEKLKPWRHMENHFYDLQPQCMLKSIKNWHSSK